MDEEYDFFGDMGIETNSGEVAGELGTVYLPADDVNVPVVETDATDSFLSKLYGSIGAAATSIVNSAAQRITSTGDVIGQRIAQPTPRQSATGQAKLPGGGLLGILNSRVAGLPVWLLVLTSAIFLVPMLRRG